MSLPLTLQNREEYVAKGLLRSDRTDDGKLAIYTYTDKCVWEQAWDDITLNSRGHIFDLETGKCIAQPFSKFFNYGECPKGVKPVNLNQPYEVFVKCDGWLGSSFYHNGSYKIASRGSFHSSGAIWATKFIQPLQTKLSWIGSNICGSNITLVFEIISKEQRIVLDYPNETLILLAAFDCNTGEELSRNAVVDYGRFLNLPIVEKVDLTFENCLNQTKLLENAEGWVIRFEDGSRVKVKTDWYCKISKIMSEASLVSLWETMVNGRVDTVSFAFLPNELRAKLGDMVCALECAYELCSSRYWKACGDFIKTHNGNRKQMGLHLTDLEPPLRKAVFAVLDNNIVAFNKVVMDSIYPKNNVMVKL